MDRKKIVETVVEKVAEKLSMDIKNITENAKFSEDLNADSLDMVDLVMEIEETYDIKIPDEDVENFKTVKDVIDYLVSKL